GISLLVFVLLYALLYLLEQSNKTTEIGFGYAVSLAIFVLGFFTIIWAAKKSLKTFLGFVLGGMFIRFILLGLAIYLLMRFAQIDIVYFMVSFLIFYLICQIVEIRFINAEFFKGRKWRPFSKTRS
ncbi:MAG: hypothetical protein ONB16_11505, partial [candidate division KSB1 bacterium]|nr:hypothetical protein [candidate division KSB1 bacterium]